MQVIDQGRLVGEIVSSHIDDGDSERHGFDDRAVPWLREDHIYGRHDRFKCHAQGDQRQDASQSIRDSAIHNEAKAVHRLHVFEGKRSQGDAAEPDQHDPFRLPGADGLTERRGLRDGRFRDGACLLYTSRCV